MPVGKIGFKIRSFSEFGTDLSRTAINSKYEAQSSNTSKNYDNNSDDSENEEQLLYKTESNNSLNILQMIEQLKTKLEEQYVEQSKYQEKLNSVNQAIKSTSEQIAHYANLLSGQSSIPKTAKYPRPAEIVPSERLQMGKRSKPLPPLENINKTLKKHKIDSSNSSNNSLPVKTHKNIVDIPYATKRTMDIYTIRAKESDMVFVKKPRSIMYNIAEDSSNKHLSNLMIATSLAGDVQFWNAKEKRMLKTIGSDHLYDSWIEDICWVTPKALALCPAQKSTEPVKMIYINDVDNADVKGRVHIVGSSPHDSGISVIGALRESEYSDSCKIVTGGFDRCAYLWSLKRDNPSDPFERQSVEMLPLKHTSALTAFCHDSYNDLMVMGGQDERISVFDIQKGTVIRTNRSTGKICQIIQSNLNPNIILITRSLQKDQFQIYDLRESDDKAIKLKFGQNEKDNLSRYVKADMHKNGYMVACGGQETAKVNFWDLRYCGVSSRVSFSVDVPKTPKILVSMFIPGQDTMVTASSTRYMNWLDYSVRNDEIIKEFE
ncbi:hypothetical protein G6F21_001943 [Rhizopus arrhizus]|nr:hypothetical protein G6F21_001943 [Rhizopus arrhizus]